VSLTADDLGVLGNLGKALGFLDGGGNPDPSWFGKPDESLKNVLANEVQRDALVAFVDEALGGADRETDPSGVVWLPIVSIEDPTIELSITLDDRPDDFVALGIGVVFRTDDPASRTTLSLPLFRAAKVRPTNASPLLLGQPGARLSLTTSITVDADEPTPGEAHLGAIGLELDIPTNSGDAPPSFGLTLTDLQLPGATTPSTLNVSAAEADELDDAVMDLVLSLVRQQAAAVGGGAIAAVAGLLGLTGGAVPAFPIDQLASDGVIALAAWMRDLIDTTASRQAWLDHLADLLQGSRQGDTVELELGDATLRLGVLIDSGPSGNPRLTPTLALVVGDDDARVEATANLCRIDLVTGDAETLPALGLWAAVGHAGNRVLEITNPTVARADTLRVGFAMDATRRLTFVLAADQVRLGTHDYPTLDLTSPDAVMDVAGNAVEDVAEELLDNLGDALATARVLLGLDAPTGQATDTISLADLLTDPLAAVAGYWSSLLDTNRTIVPDVLAVLRNALADGGSVVASIRGDGTPMLPWRIPLTDVLSLDISTDGPVVTIAVSCATSIDTLGQRCTVIDTRLTATLAEIDLAARSASLLPGVHGVLSARERGVNPPRITLPLADGITVTATSVGLRLGWTATAGLAASIEVPELSLQVGDDVLPVALPVIGSDGTVDLDDAGWNTVQLLIGELGSMSPGTVGELLRLLGWSGTAGAGRPGLRLADLVDDPLTALGEWLPELALSELGPHALELVADLIGGVGPVTGAIAGSGHPDDPYRIPLGANIPEPAVWFPPAGLEPPGTAVPEAMARWRPGDLGLTPVALEDALRAEANIDRTLAELVRARAIAAGLAAITDRWSGSDGRIAPPLTPPAGIGIVTAGVAAGQLLGLIDLETELDRVPTTVVYVDIGSASWPGAPAARRIDLTATGLAPAMFTLPAAAAGEWFVALGTKTACQLASGDADGTGGQTARLGRVLETLAPLGNDLVVVAVGGAGHAARHAADANTSVSDLVLVGTPLGPVSLTALTTQPSADALRLLHRLMPPAAAHGDEPDDADLALGRHLVAAMITLVDQPDPAAELRPPITEPPAGRAGLTVSAWFGQATRAQVERALTAVVAAGLAERARQRDLDPLPPPTGVFGGLVLGLPPNATGTLRIEGDARMTLLGYDRSTGLDPARSLRVRVWVSDRLGWLISTPEQELRAVSVDATIPLGSGQGRATVTLHDARVLGQSWERLVIGADAAEALLPEARLLLTTAVQRLIADAATNPTAQAVVDLGDVLGLIDSGGAVHDAFDQLVHDASGLVASVLATARADLATAVSALLGPVAVDLDAGTVRVTAGSDTTGRFGWHANVTITPSITQTINGAPAFDGAITFGRGTELGAAGAVELVVDLEPFAADVRWHHPGGATDTVALWPTPDGATIARMLAVAAPSLGGHVALELMRRADDAARPIIDAVLDAFGMLAGSVGDVDRAIRPLAGFLSDPAGWLRSSESIAAQPAKAQVLFDALRPLLGIGGAAGSTLALTTGVELSVAGEGADLRVALGIDSSVFGAPAASTGRFVAGATVAIVVGASGPPRPALALHVGLDGADPGRQAMHVALGDSGIAVFVRPTTGADILLLPFAGLGGLAAAAEAALPFLLDRLSEISGDVGDTVAAVGDALALRAGAGAARHFDGAALSAWAIDPVASLIGALPSITSTGLTTLAPLLDGFVPTDVDVTATSGELTVGNGAVSVTWSPTINLVTAVGVGIAVPGIDRLSFAVTVSPSGLDSFSVTVGPADIDAGGVTISPFVHVAAGASPAGGAGLAVGLALDDTHRFSARWLFGPSSFALTAGDGQLVGLDTVTDPVAVATRVVETVIDLVAAVAMAETAVQELLDTDIGNSSVRDVLQDVLLDGTDLIAGVFDPATLLDRTLTLFENLAGAGLSVSFEGLTLTLREQSDVIGLELALADRLELVSDDVVLWLENDGSWIEDLPAGAEGIFVGAVTTTGGLEFTPSISVNGVGLRVGKLSGPLLDIGLSLESIAFHTFAAIDATGFTGGGLQLQLSNLAVSASGASGGNAIAQGIVADSGPQPPKPAFSPAFAVQQHEGEPVHVTLRAGDGEGPWWVAIQRGFGPLYLEQIGLGVTMPNQQVERVSLFLDGSVSMFGLTCTVDDLQITYLVSKNDFFNPASWDIDLAGLAVSADMSGVTIAGGLLKNVSPTGDTEYLGMLLGRFGVYGITIYGGYGQGTDGGETFVAFFAIGAVVGPIGGPPAFFLTGIGGGFGINRALVVPTDLSKFGEYPLIQALDTAASPGNPMEQLRALGAYFPMERGTFWFAAGLSFTSFVIVDGIAVVAVEIGDGLDISLLGLARLALPRPQVALVSIELALVVRFSSSEGVLWVQGQLTDNSYLLYSDVKLTGGFAYVIWFKGPNAGQFVLTMGGYHPDFHRDGYPDVPRLGLRWSVSNNILVQAGSYFALTSEALMAGGDFEASASFGPAWAEVRFGAHGIVYFDPFHYKVMVYASIAAGVTIDTWIFGEITISISIGARIEVEGPDFHGKATFEVGPIELEVEFGSTTKHIDPPLSPTAFIDKYLDVAPSGDAQAITVITTFGTQPADSGAPTPDGKPDRPYIVVCEFGLILTSVVPASSVTRLNPGSSGTPVPTTTSHPPTRTLGVAPMHEGAMQPSLSLSFIREGTSVDDLVEFPFAITARPFGSFPVGVWGPPQDDDNRPLPKGDVIEALCELELSATATELPGGPEIPYFQVEIGQRHPLPFSRRTTDVDAVRTAGTRLTALVTRPDDVDSAFAAATTFLGSTASPTALAALRGERQSPPIVGTLGEGLDTVTDTVVPDIGIPVAAKLVDTFVYPAEAIAVMPAAGAVSLGDASRAGARTRTTVKDSARLWRATPPTLASVEADRSVSIAAGLIVVEPPAATVMTTRRSGTLLPTGDVPPSETARAAPALITRRGGESNTELRAFSAALRARRRMARGSAGATLGPGDVAVLRLPNFRRDVDPGAERPALGVHGPGVRIVAIADGGRVVDDRLVDDVWTVGQGIERLAVIGLGTPDESRPVSSAGLWGWHAGLQLPYVGWSTAVGSGCTVHSRGQGIAAHDQRAGAGWVSGAELARGVSTVTTRFAQPVASVVVVLDDPNAFGGNHDGRDLVLGLSGGARATDAAGALRPPVVLTAEQRNVVAYDIVPELGDDRQPVTVTVASEEGFAVAGVLGAEDLTAESAIAVISARGLDAATAPVAVGGSGITRLEWRGPTAPPTEPSRKPGSS